MILIFSKWKIKWNWLEKKLLARQGRKLKSCGFTVRNFRDTESGALEKARKFFEENPFTWEMLEELRKGNPVRVDAGRKGRRPS